MASSFAASSASVSCLAEAADLVSWRAASALLSEKTSTAAVTYRRVRVIMRYLSRWGVFFYHPCPLEVNRSNPAERRLSNKEGVFFVGGPAVTGTLVGTAQGAEHGLEGGHDRQAFARRGDDRLLNDAGGLVDADGQIGQQPIDLFGLNRRDRRRPRRLVGDRRGLGRNNRGLLDEGPNVTMNVGDRLLRLRTRRRIATIAPT